MRYLKRKHRYIKLELLLTVCLTGLSLLGGCGAQVETPEAELELPYAATELKITEYESPLWQNMVLLEDGVLFASLIKTGEEEGYGCSYKVLYESVLPDGSTDVKSLLTVEDCYLLKLDAQAQMDAWTISLLVSREDGYFVEEYTQSGEKVSAMPCEYDSREKQETLGHKIESKDGNTYEVTADGIFAMEQNQRSDVPVVSFRTVDIPAQSVYGVYQYSDEVLLLQYYTNGTFEKARLLRIPLNKALETPQKNEAQKYTATGKRIIEIYCPYGDIGKYMLDAAIIEGFNLENEAYEVVIKEGSIERKNTDLLQQDGPDLVMELVNSALADYERNGYLENLVPYFTESGTYRDLTPVVREIYETTRGELYSIPQSLYFETMAIPASKADGKTSWTVEVFLQWVANHPEISTSKQVLLLDCLMGNLEQYMDMASGKAHFTESPFLTMLSLINQLPCPVVSEDGSVDPTNQGVEYYIYSTADLAKYERLMGEEMVVMGLPNDMHHQVSPCENAVTLSLLRNSGCKEGAVAFLEYWLHYPQYSIAKAEKEGSKTEGKLLALASLKEQEIALSLGEGMTVYYTNKERLEVAYEITPQHVTLFDACSKSIIRDDAISVQAREIILEEATDYFRGDKSLEQVCEIMQSRVEILLQE